MNVKYAIDADGNFLGAFAGGDIPSGSTEVSHAPVNAGQKWLVDDWDAYDNSDELTHDLWAAATEYEAQFITGTAPSMVAVNAAAGKTKAQAVEAWSRGIWEDYHQRKADVQNASMDFSNHGPMPHTILELMEE